MKSTPKKLCDLCMADTDAIEEHERKIAEFAPGGFAFADDVYRTIDRLVWRIHCCCGGEQ